MTLEEIDSQISTMEREWIAAGEKIRELTAQRDQIIHEAQAKEILAGLSPAQIDCIVRAAAVDARTKVPTAS